MLKTFVIETPGREASLLLRNKLAEWNLDTTYIEGVVGSELSSTKIDGLVNLELLRHRIGYEPPLSLVGCGLSHRKVYRSIMEMGTEWALVLESDSKPVEDPSCLVETLKQEKFRNAPCVIQLFSRGERLVNRKVIARVFSGEVERARIYRFLYPPRQAAAYMINRLAAIKALDETVLSGPPDWPSWSASVEFFAVYPWFFSETNEGSTIPTVYRGNRQNTIEKFRVLSGHDFFRSGRLYNTRLDYFRLKVKPIFLRSIWKILGKRKLNRNGDAPWVIF